MSKKVTSRARRSLARTRETLAALAIFEKATTSAIRGPSVPQVVQNNACPPLSVDSYFSQRKKGSLRARGFGSWAETTDLEKIKFGVRAIKELGGIHALAFNLNLAPDVEARARSNPDWFRRLLIRKVGNPVPLIMVFGACRNGRVHVHGAYAATDADDAQRIDGALEDAGGTWASSRGQCYQLVPKPLGDASGPVDGWSQYLVENIRSATEVLPAGRLWSMTNVARRKAKVIYCETRHLVNGRCEH